MDLSLSESRRLVAELMQAEAARREAAARADFERTESRERELRRGQAEKLSHEREFTAWQAELGEERDRTLSELEATYQAQQRSTSTEYQVLQKQAQSELDGVTAAAKKERDDNAWLVESVLDDESPDSPSSRLAAARSAITLTEQELTERSAAVFGQAQSAQEYLRKCRLWRNADEDEDVAAQKLPEDPAELVTLHRAASDRLVEVSRLARRQFAFRLFQGPLPVLLFLAIAAGCWGALWTLLDPSSLSPGLRKADVPWLLILSGAALMPAGLLMGLMYSSASNHARGIAQELTELDASIKASELRWKKQTQTELKAKEKELESQQKLRASRRSAQVAKAEQTYLRATAAASQRFESERKRLASIYPGRLANLERRYETDRQRLSTDFAHRIEEREVAAQAKTSELAAEHERRLSEIDDAYRDQIIAVAESWRRSVQRFERETNQRDQWRRDAAPDWSRYVGDWNLPTSLPPAIPYGQISLELDEVEPPLDALTASDPLPHRFQWPLSLTLDQTPSLIAQVDAATRPFGVRLLQAVTLRWLAMLPAGKVRFTFIDPVGLGESFASLMHLADYDELLISSRIWTEPSHIEQRLAQLTEHMETVFQTYLRDEFRSIAEYNEQAGEVAEPYRVVVVANFPHGFSDLALRRLVSMATGGPRCGVFLLMSHDLSQDLPRGVSAAELATHASVVRVQSDRLEIDDDVLGRLPLVPESPPTPHEYGAVVRRAGELSKAARRVEVPFDRVAPPEDSWWTESTQAGFETPIGRSGAKKTQFLSLGRGTSQHVLIAGKTGSGKSSLLHAIITSAALRYSPDELELYLVDFKKGVEFKTYAGGRLPHARVIAIESDREFGLSVLERLDAVLKERGELFRDQGVQDLPSFRAAVATVRMPRIVLVIDEFQEFFTEDDSLAGTASLLLDRLIRQGRAFGVHIILGSQTLAGAYSLARSTLGQVAVRVALQCSESDSHLILSEDNTAARLLTRPGEAIYNDANGLVEGNHPFQVVWLSESQRDDYLKRLGTRPGSRRAASRQTVFEGNIPADPSANTELSRQLEALAAHNEPHRADVCWLGDPVAIKGPTELPFPPQSGSNLLIVGSSAELAQGVLSGCLVSLASQRTTAWMERQSQWSLEAGDAHGESSSSTASGPLPWITLLDGSTIDPKQKTLWQSWAEVAPGARRLIPGEAAEALNALVREMEARAGQPGIPIYVVLVGLSRFRDLRKADDDFGFGSSSGPATPAQQLAALLKDGPAVGVHVVVWSETLGDAQRWLSRESLAQFEYRIIFQMNAADSSTLVDSPAGSKLGPHRALLLRDDLGLMEKFRPYRSPDSTWLQFVAARLSPRGSVSTAATSTFAPMDESVADRLLPRPPAELSTVHPASGDADMAFGSWSESANLNDEDMNDEDDGSDVGDGAGIDLDDARSDSTIPDERSMAPSDAELESNDASDDLWENLDELSVE